MKILLVDDSRLEQAILKGVLGKLGHETVEASNGVEALELFMATQPDIILLDVNMPVMDGLETARRIRALPLEWTPIIFLSANTEPENIAAGIDAGGDDYLTKPANKVVLAAKLLAMQRIANMKSMIARIGMPSLRQEIADVAEMDSISGFASTAAGHRMTSRELSRCSRSGQPICLFIAGINAFDDIALEHGEAGTEQCLRKLAVAVHANACRMADFSFRHSKNAFAVIMPDTPMTGALRVAERIRCTILELDPESGETPRRPLRFGISVGVASVVPMNGKEAENLLETAEEALQQAMQEGGRKVVAIASNVPFRLTARELECLQWSAIGKSSWEIASILTVSEAAVNFHMANIRGKFGVTSRRQAVAQAIRYGLIRAA